MDFDAELATLGFELMQRDRRGVLQYARQANRFLTEWVHDDGHEALFTWEFDISAYCETQGWQLGTGEAILYPQFDVRLARTLDAVIAELQRLEGRLRRLDLSDPAL